MPNAWHQKGCGESRREVEQALAANFGGPWPWPSWSTAGRRRGGAPAAPPGAPPGRPEPDDEVEPLDRARDADDADDVATNGVDLLLREFGGGDVDEEGHDRIDTGEPGSRPTRGRAGGDFGGLLESAQQALSAQAEAAEQVVTGTAGGGVVSVEMTGGGEVRSVTLVPEVVDPDDVEMLQDLIVAALHDAGPPGHRAPAPGARRAGGDILGGMPGLPGPRAGESHRRWRSTPVPSRT